MDNWFRSKWFVRLISLTFAIILYMFVQSTVQSSQSDSASSGNGSEMQTLDDVPVEIRIDDNFVVSGVPEYVTVSLEGPPNYLRPIVLQRNFDVYVDLEGLDEGEHTVEIEHDISSQLTMSIEPSEIDIYIEERVSENFQVSADFTNQEQLPDGYELGNYEINPSVVSITSSNSVIDRIGTVKVFVDLAGVAESIDNQEAPVRVYDAKGNELSANVQPEKVKVSAEILNPSKMVSVHVPTKGELPEGYSLVSIASEQEEVEVFAKSDILTGMNSISTEEVDLSQITESGIIELGFKLPDGVVTKQKKVEVDVELKLTKEIEDIPVKVDGIDEQTFEFIDPEEGTMSVTVTGNDIDVVKLTKADIRLVANASGLVPGQHNLPVEIEWDSEKDYEELVISTELEEIRIDIE